MTLTCCSIIIFCTMQNAERRYTKEIILVSTPAQNKRDHNHRTHALVQATPVTTGASRTMLCFCLGPLTSLMPGYRERQQGYGTTRQVRTRVAEFSSPYTSQKATLGKASASLTYFLANICAAMWHPVSM